MENLIEKPFALWRDRAEEKKSADYSAQQRRELCFKLSLGFYTKDLEKLCFSAFPTLLCAFFKIQKCLLRIFDFCKEDHSCNNVRLE